MSRTIPANFRCIIARFLNGRDLYGDLAKAAHDDGLFVMARMDSNRTAEDFFKAHPDWFARDADGKPYRADDKYITCINSPYYDEYLPDVLREISSGRIRRGSPITVGREWAAEASAIATTASASSGRRPGNRIPPRANWDDPAYRQWIMWNYGAARSLGIE